MRLSGVVRGLFIPLLLLPSVAFAQSNLSSTRFTIQVGAFPDRASADQLIARLTRAGLQPIWGLAELPGRGVWTRVFLGHFKTISEAKRYGNELVRQGVIKEYIVRSAKEMRALSRPRNVTRDSEPFYSWKEKTTTSIAQIINQGRGSSFNSHPASQLGNHSGLYLEPLLKTGKRGSGKPPSVRNSVTASMLSANASRSSYFYGREPDRFLPQKCATPLRLVPSININDLPRPDPVSLAFNLVLGDESFRSKHASKESGLWISGDIEEALARLSWIVGPENASLFLIDETGKVILNSRRLAAAVGVEQLNAAAQPLVLASYITSNEGLLLLVQLTQGRYAYRLHIGKRAPTHGVEIPVAGSINLDNNFDPRINPYRRKGQKLDQELPPERFDSLVAINPSARWFNLPANSLVPVGHITFHELAEAYAKIGLGLDYLGHDSRPGAHDVALERETRLKAQRPGEVMVLTTGSNRVLRSEEEARHFFSEAAAASNNPR